jgi:hypothetical protein
LDAGILHCKGVCALLHGKALMPNLEGGGRNIDLGTLDKRKRDI